MRIWLVMILAFVSISCAGKGWIFEWEANDDGDLELKKATHFEGRNIKCNTEKSAGFETQNLELPSVPFVR